MKLLIFMFILTPLVISNNTISYLQRYGYLQENALSDDIEQSVKLFQETFGLESTGILDNETLNIMDTPRCGNKDDLLPFSANLNNAWPITNITWHMVGPQKYRDVIEKAFTLWEKHSNLKFRRDSRNPTIYLTLSDSRHLFYSSQNKCPYDFDGPGGVLGHAYLPEPNSLNQTDVHFDKEEKWDISLVIPSDGKKSLYLVAVHEIGHALGLSHSYVNTSVMWPLYRAPYGMIDFNNFDLGKDDINAIHFLYGIPHADNTSDIGGQTTEKTVETTTLTENTSKSSELESVIELDLCTLEDKIDNILVLKQRIFLFYENYVWILALEPAQRTPEEYKYPKLVTDWLPFIPKFKKISAIYQKSHEEIVLFIDWIVYFIRTPSLNLIKRVSVRSISGRVINKINAVVKSNLGVTYMFVDDWYVLELNECTLRGRFLGITSGEFNGIPGKLEGVFKYTNGRLYFSTSSSILEYNEYLETVTSSETSLFNILQITCVRETLIKKLQDLINYLNS